MTLSPTSWQLASEANEQEAHALTAELVHNIFFDFAVLFLTNPFSHSMFCNDSFCSACSICIGMLLPTFSSFVLNTCQTPNLPSCLFLHLCLSLSLSVCPSLSMSVHLSSSWSAISFHPKLAVSPTLHHLPSVCLGVPSLLYPVCGIV